MFRSLPVAPSDRFRALFESSDDPVLVTDRDGRYVDANPAVLALLGYTRDELLQLSVGDVSVHEPAASSVEFARLKFEGVWLGESRLRRKDGSIVEIETRAIEVDLPEGTLYYGIFRDRASRQQTEAALRESEERLRLATEAAGMYAWEIDVASQSFQWSPNAARIVDVSMPRTIDETIGVVHPDDRKRVQATLVQAMELGGEFRLEYRFADRPPGDELWVLSAGVALPDRSGVPVRVVGVTQDITARKRAEEALRESEARYRTLVHHGGTTVWRTGADGEQLLESQGGVVKPYDSERGPTSDWLDLYTHPEDRKGTLAAWRHAVDSRSVYNHQQRVRSMDGSYRWVQGHAVPVLDDRGEVREWIGTSTDITEQKRLEQLRLDVMAMVSHDLRTPLAVIGMRAQFMQSWGAFDAESLQVIREQTQRMTRLIDDLGDVVRLESGQLVLLQETLDLRAVVQEAADRGQAQTNRHVIRAETPQMPVVGAWDRARLEEVLDNLIGNAVKYSPEGGEILVKVEADDKEARLRVVDGGLGISEEALPRLFERFHRADGTGLPGLGLGLYIARMLVEAHGGRIEVASSPGEGSTFTVWLPRHLDAEQAR